MRLLRLLAVLTPTIAFSVAIAHLGTRNQSIDTPYAVNGPFRDGLYLGKLDAEAGRAEHVASGRWSQLQDRESFAAGYRLAYVEAQAGRSKKIKGTAEASLVR